MNDVRKTIQDRFTSLYLSALVLAGCWISGVANAATISEPPTTFYGKVIGIGGAQPFLMDDGALSWTILRADGSELQIETALFSLNNGVYSYKLEVPCTATAIGLDSGSGFPMPPTANTNEHARAFVNGLPAEFAGPSGSFFEVGQQSRAATYRLDLNVNIAPRDSDGDGIPDWWEDLYGLDSAGPADALLDSDGDGISNRNEYLLGLNPNLDNRLPGLLTDGMLAYVGNTTGMRLLSSDTDSAASNILYTVTDLPAFGRLVLRNAVEDPAGPDLDLVVGGQFTQYEVNSGQLVFVQEGDVSTASNTAFSVTVQDEDAAHPFGTGEVAIHFYEPPAFDVFLSEAGKLRKQAFLAIAANDAVVWDAADELMGVAVQTPSSGMDAGAYAALYQPKFGAEHSQYILGGRGDDMLVGGMADDVLIGGRGYDVMAGGGGLDQFLFNEHDLGTDRIIDYSAVDGDVLDFSRLLAGASGLVDNFIQFETVGSDTLVQVALDGNGIVFTNLTVELAGVSFTESETYDLVIDGRMKVGGLKLLPRLTVTASDAVASENGGNSGVFTLEREGDWSKVLTVNIAVAGSAVNGVDYSSVASTVHFAAGQKTATVTISPFADNVIEADEVVELVLVENAAYLIGAQDRAVVIIKDLQAVVGIEVEERLATMDPMSPAMLLVTRNGQTANPLYVRLTIGGKASNGIDYQRVPAYVNFGAGVTVVPIEIVPLSSAVLDGGAEVVDISVKADASYALADVATGRATIVARRDTLAEWQSREFSGTTSSLQDFALEDSGNTGVDHLLRYAYGMDPLNPEMILLPTIVWRDGHMTVDVHRNPEATDIAISVDVSSDLATWDSSESKVRGMVAPEHKTAADIETYEVVPLVETENTLYLRVRVELNP